MAGVVAASVEDHIELLRLRLIAHHAGRTRFLLSHDLAVLGELNQARTLQVAIFKLGERRLHIGLLVGVDLLTSSANKAPEQPVCEHKNQTKHGTNAHVKMVKCKDCGKVLEYTGQGDAACG